MMFLKTNSLALISLKRRRGPSLTSLKTGRDRSLMSLKTGSPPPLTTEKRDTLPNHTKNQGCRLIIPLKTGGGPP